MRCIMNSAVKEKERLKEKIDVLPPELIQEVLDFVEFLLMKKGGVDYTYLIAQQRNLEKIWLSDAEDLYEL
ncbi:MAG: DUF2281 domain-containing protein [bacterium]